MYDGNNEKKKTKIVPSVGITTLAKVHQHWKIEEIIGMRNDFDWRMPGEKNWVFMCVVTCFFLAYLFVSTSPQGQYVKYEQARQ